MWDYEPEGSRRHPFGFRSRNFIENAAIKKRLRSKQSRRPYGTLPGICGGWMNGKWSGQFNRTAGKFSSYKKTQQHCGCGCYLVMFHSLLDIYGMYHTSGNFSAGVCLLHKRILFIYRSFIVQDPGTKRLYGWEF
jgi:hypothetical protein